MARLPVEIDGIVIAPIFSVLEPTRCRAYLNFERELNMTNFLLGRLASRINEDGLSKYKILTVD